MSDPLSIAGTAVGITSLGIQVCQGLVGYLRSVRGRRAEIAEDLSEVQTLITIFYSLNYILPKIDQTRCAEATTIRRYLEECEGKLLELQQLLIKLRGPQQSTTNREKMREAGRTFIYPFRVDTLKSLRQSLRSLLDNLNLAIDIKSLESQVTFHDKIDTISLTIQDLETESKEANICVQDLGTKMQENLSQLRSLESTITDSLTEINQRVSQAQWAIQDIGSKISGKLTVTETEVVSNRRVMVKMFTEMAEKLDSQSAEISRLGIQLSSIHDQGGLLLDGPPKRVTHCASKTGSSNRLISPMCDCRRASRPSGFSFAFWNLKFEFQQQVPGKHRRTCKFFGIDGQTQRRVNAQFPLKLAWFSARMTLAYMEYAMGTSSPGCSVRFKNVVPGRYSPVLSALIETGENILASRSVSETIRLLEGTEREILSLYRERRASPGDVDESGRCHMRMFIDIFANLDYMWVYHLGFYSHKATELQERVWCDKSVLAMVLRILQVLNDLVQADDICVDLFHSPFFKSNKGEKSDVRLNGRQGSEIVSYLATTQHFDSKSLIRQCLEEDVISSFYSVPEVMDVMGLPPMARAIVSRSVSELERCILSNPNGVKEKVWGHTALHLSVAWPEGLKILLTTEARDLVHDDEIDWSWDQLTFLALRVKCDESLDMLMKAGFRLNVEFGWARTSPECAMIVARRLFERRAKLFALAQNELKDFDIEFTCGTSEKEARFLYDNLVIAGIPVDPGLDVEHDLTTIFHCPGLPLDYFRIFFENGFRNHWDRDELGLTPAMLWHDNNCSGDDKNKTDVEGWLSNLQWLQEEGFLDHSPEDPCNLGLNTKSTGWHYLAALACFQRYLESAKIVLQELSRSSTRDRCVCWCMPESEGCSPLGSIFKAHADNDEGVMGTFWMNNLEKLLYDLGCGDQISTIMAPFLRFITFEALEMTHTCCRFGVLDKYSLEWVTCDNGRPDYVELGWDKTLVILDYDASMIQETRADQVEQKNAALLDSLMEEFISQLGEGEPTMETFVDFLNGYWRPRMEQLFAVNEDVVNRMKECLSNVRTHVWPERVRRFFSFGLWEPEDPWGDAESVCDAEHDLSNENCF